MKRMLCATVVACSLLLGYAAGTLALPPSPIREAAQFDRSCPVHNGASGRFTHGAWVSGVVQGFYSYPTDPIEPCAPISEV